MTTIPVTRCDYCPFLRCQVKSMGDTYWCDRASRADGVLRLPNGPPLPEVPPDWCPLRAGSVLVQLAGTP
jgi:hypothetical protein